MDSSQPDPYNAFQCIAQVGTDGDSSERPMEALIASLSPAMQDAPGCNQGFLRDDAILVDAGQMFPGDEQPGVDAVVPDFSFLHDCGRLHGLLLTHGHEDHIGAVPFLLERHDPPVHGGRFTLGLLRRRLAERAPELRPKLVPFTDEPIYSAAASYAMGRADGDDATGIGPQQTAGTLNGFSHTDNMSCASCHASWTNGCIGCHLGGE